MLPGRPTHRKRAAVGILSRWRQDISGVAAIEFAFLVPVLLIMLLATIEVSRAISMDRRFSLVTAQIGDLVSREKTIAPTPTSSLGGIMKSAQAIMAPYNASSLKLNILSVQAIKADTTQGTVKWSYACDKNGCTAAAAALATCSKYTLPNNIVSQGSSVIVVESQYSYSPLFVDWSKKQIHLQAGSWNEKSYHSPRQACVDDGNSCSAPTACPNG